jgi:ABC-2 type transport system permease protein
MTTRAPRWPTTTVQTSAQRVLAERGGLLVSVAFYVLVTAVLSSLWRLAAHANGGTVAGYSAAAVTWYIATTEACTVSLNIRLIADIGQDIASGAVAVELVRPVSVLGLRVAIELGRVLPRLLACLAAGAVLATVAGGAPPRPTALAFALPSTLLAVATNVMAQHAFAAAAFWLRDAGSTWFLYHKLVFVLGGMLIPLEALPGWLHHLAAALPFAAMAYAPGRLASGHVEPWLLAEQLAWLVVLGAAATAAFASGQRRLQVVGG